MLCFPCSETTPESRKKAALGRAAIRAHENHWPRPKTPENGLSGASRGIDARSLDHPFDRDRPKSPVCGSDNRHYRLCSTGEIGDRGGVVPGVPWGMTSFGEAARPAIQPRPCQRNPAAITPNAFFVAPVATGPSPLDAVFWGSRGRRRMGSRSRFQGGARVFGEGLGGGYRTPPNERDVSAANAEKGGGLGSGKGVQTASYPQAVFARAD